MKKEDFLKMIEKLDFEKVLNFNVTVMTSDQNNFNINNNYNV